MSKPLSFNGLVGYLHNKKGIDVSSDRQKQYLYSIGYFHGYKGYRYAHKPQKLLKYKNFDELYSVVEFDMQLKGLLYPYIMFFETALKNHVLTVVLDKAQSYKFADIYALLINNHKQYLSNSNDYKKEYKKKLKLQSRIYNIMSMHYDNSNIITHYYNNDRPVPIWAIFEILSLGEFATFVECLNFDTRKEISKLFNINAVDDTNFTMLTKIIFALKDLRNSIAHNNIIFDARFSTSKLKKSILNFVNKNIGTGNYKIDLTTITDYIILLALILHYLGMEKDRIIAFIDDYNKICDELYNSVHVDIFNTILFTDWRVKLTAIKKIL